MKIFLLVLFAATIIGGFVGGEIMDKTFSLLGAVIGGIGTGASLLGLGAYFDAQERKKKEELPPEMRAVFDRMLGRDKTQNNNPLLKTISSLIEEDRKLAEAGVKGETRLIPHERIKLEIMIKAYGDDCNKAIAKIQANKDIPEYDRAEKIKKMKRDIDELTYNLRREPHAFLSKHFEEMKKARGDFKKFEEIVRKENSMFSMVPPLEL